MMTETTNKRSEQKELAQVLDRCAERAYSVGGRPASGKQVWFLAGLICKVSCNVDRDISGFRLDNSFVLTAGKASQMIDEALELSKEAK